MNNKYKKVILLSGDIAILYLSLYLTLLLRYLKFPGQGVWQNHFYAFTLMFIGWLIVFYIADLYNLIITANSSELFQKALTAIGIAGLLSFSFFYLSPRLLEKIIITPKTVLFVFIIIFTVLFLSWRNIFNWALNAYLPKNKISFIGFNEQVEELIGWLKNKPALGYEISHIFGDTNSSINNIPITNDISQLKNIIVKKHINTLILAADPHQSPNLRQELFACLSLKLNFINLANFYEQTTGKVPIAAISEMWFLENLSEGNKVWYDRFKRFYDLAIAAFILIITAPFWPLIGAMLKIENKEPIFFLQTRVGRDGKNFKIIKFRTQKSRGTNPGPAKRGDKRTTKVGNFLRKTRIDEIPQVLNIILGDMSFIGPRPERPKLIERLERDIPFYNERLLIKPGLTGWDQVSGEYHSPSREDTLKKLQYDLFYIKNRSLYLDLSIILKTIATVIKRAGV